MKEYAFAGKTMGTDFALAIVSDSKKEAERLAQYAIEEMHLYDQIFSRFSEESELSKLNREKDMKVSSIFMKVTEESYKLFSKTKGVFNPLVQIERFGYDKDFSLLDDEEINENKEEYDIDFSSTVINSTDSRILLKEGQKIDFGGFLKGYLAELICKKIKNDSKHITGVIVNIGGDIHTEGLDEQGNTFIFDIYNPVTQKDDAVSLPLFNQSLATSGTYKRSWRRAGVLTHHILDASGEKNPETDIISSSVITDEGGKAEAYAKVLLSAGVEEGLTILKNENIVFVVIKKNGEIIKNSK